MAASIRAINAKVAIWQKHLNSHRVHSLLPEKITLTKERENLADKKRIRYF
jgi:hypothetical protein